MQSKPGMVFVAKLLMCLIFRISLINLLIAIIYIKIQRREYFRIINKSLNCYYKHIIQRRNISELLINPLIAIINISFKEGIFQNY